MDGNQFDSITRSFAGRSTRRLLLGRGAALAGALGGLAMVDSASAARRGNSGGSTAICAPNGSGGYTRTSVPTLFLNVYLNSGYILSDCCAHAECGESNGCMDAYCDFGSGSCAVSYSDGSSCERGGCAPGTCSGGVCYDPTPMLCGGDGYCNDCVYDACSHYCECYVQPCYTDDWQCQSSDCDPSQGACINTPINEGSTCDTFGVEGVCTMGYCTSA